MGFEKRFLSPAQTAAYLGVHVQTIYSWLGWLPVVRIGKKGRTIRIDKKKLDAALEAQLEASKKKSA